MSEKEVLELLKENLRIRVDKIHEHYNYDRLRVSLLLNEEVIDWDELMVEDDILK